MFINEMNLSVVTTFSLLLFAPQVYSQSNSTETGIDSFLANLFNTTFEGIIDIANKFQFVQIPANDVTFVCYLPNNQTTNITAENYTQVIDIQKRTIFIIHGWTKSAYTAWVPEMASRYHETKDCNVIAINWSIWASQNYFFSATAVQAVGFLVGDFIQVLFNQDATVLERIHVIGHSLGAQAAGFTGKRVISLTNQLLDRITGLDAAGPLFEIPIERPSNLRLDVSDAGFVDLIHTDQGLEGVRGSYGKCDFFVNGGGPIQPGCEDIGDFEEIMSCSHESAHEYYTKSIYESSLFEAYSCLGSNFYDLGLCNNNAKAVMGETVSREARGNYYLNIYMDFNSKNISSY